MRDKSHHGYNYCAYASDRFPGVTVDRMGVGLKISASRTEHDETLLIKLVQCAFCSQL